MSEIRNSIIEAIQADLELASKADANRVFNSVCEVITKTFQVEGKKAGFRFNLPGIGIFKTKEIEAKTHRDPRNGEKIEKAARNKLVFRISKELRDVGIKKVVGAKKAAKGKKAEE